MSLANYYLQEMGVDLYQVRRPERINYSYQQPIELDKQCRLLLVAQQYPTQSEIRYLSKILQSMALTLEQIQFIEVDFIQQVNQEGVEWLWLCGVEPIIETRAKLLTSPALSDIPSSTAHRKALWQQIQGQQTQANLSTPQE